VRHSGPTMLGEGSLREGLLALRESASTFLPTAGLGLVRPDGPDHVFVAYGDALGLTAYRLRAGDLSEALRVPGRDLRCLTAAELAASPGSVEAHILLTALPGDIRQTYGAREVVALPVPGLEPPTTLVLGVAEPGPLTSEQAAKLTRLAGGVGRELDRGESPDAEVERLRRLEVVGGVLPSLFRIPDIREVFDGVSALTKQVLPHDILGLYNADLTELTVVAQTSAEAMPDIAPTRYPVQLLEEPWIYHIVDDLLSHPFERELPLTRAGGRSSLRVAIRLEDSLFGALNFTSLTKARYTTGDVAIARRIADYVALTLSHQSLVEEVRRTESLRARAASIDLLDELLAAVTDSGELSEVFDRVSAIAKKVLPHDAMALPVLLPDRRHARIYASSGVVLPEVVEVPASLLEKAGWECEVVPEIQADPELRDSPAAKQGYRSGMRVAIRLEGQWAGALTFLSRKPSAFSMSDAPVARRIADRLTLSLSRERRMAAIRQADEATSRALALESRVKALTEELNARSDYHRVIGNAPSWRQALTQATQVAATETTVLLLGESGTGKEVVARFVHGGSARSKGPFVALNCAALPENLLEAELFGYERGAFTGAMQSKPGQLEQASGGTLFLDEVAEMSPSAQAKFLRVLQEREFQRLGGTRVLKTDARVIAATNRDLLKAMERGQFREDLYYRLNVFAIRLPPLRDRKEDILPLSEAFVSEIGRTLGRPPGGVSKEAREALLEYGWPGNVRELRNVLERAAILADGGLIAAEHLAVRRASDKPSSSHDSAAAAPAPARPAAAEPGAGDLKSVERAMIEKALQEARFNKSDAARRLGLSRAQLYVRLRRYGLE
jgi:transcriptional regulator with GAF, ATPase, and Fis domain